MHTYVRARANLNLRAVFEKQQAIEKVKRECERLAGKLERAKLAQRKAEEDKIRAEEEARSASQPVSQPVSQSASQSVSQSVCVDSCSGALHADTHVLALVRALPLPLSRPGWWD